MIFLLNKKSVNNRLFFLRFAFCQTYNENDKIVDYSFLDPYFTKFMLEIAVKPELLYLQFCFMLNKYVSIFFLIVY